MAKFWANADVQNSNVAGGYWQWLMFVFVKTVINRIELNPK